jgi:transcriptional regulator with XRE-family HTH domain
MQRAEARRWGRARILRSGVVLRAAREERKLTQRELCVRIGISTPQLSDIERGIGTLSLRRARQLADALELPFDQLVARVLQDRLDQAGLTHLRVTVSVVSEADSSEDDA